MTFRQHLRHCAAEYLSTLMMKHGGCVKRAALEADLNRTSFYELIKRHGIEPPRIGRGHRGEWHELQQ